MWLVTVHCFPTSNSQQPYGVFFFAYFSCTHFKLCPCIYAAFDHKGRDKRAVKKTPKTLLNVNVSGSNERQSDETAY